jgi:ATP-dependent DNA helicase RecQ
LLVAEKMELEQALATLKVCSLRGKQRDAIDAILRGRDVLYIFPTGTGKTLVYEVCALCSPGVSIVFSPLLGLQQQQSGKLAAHGVAVLEAWDGKVWQQGQGEVKVVYTTAEQLVQQSALRRYIASKSLSVDRIVVDEAHVVLQWETFRYCLSSLCEASFLETLLWFIDAAQACKFWDCKFEERSL